MTDMHGTRGSASAENEVPTEDERSTRTILDVVLAAPFVLGLVVYGGFCFISFFNSVISLLEAHRNISSRTINDLDPFCLPQQKVFVECDRYLIGNGTLDVMIPTEMWWSNLTSTPADAIQKDILTGDEIGDYVNITSYLRATKTFSLLDNIEGLPFVVDVMKRKDAKCKHTFLLSCSKLVSEIHTMKKSRVSEMLSFKDSIAFSEKELLLVLYVSVFLFALVGDVFLIVFYFKYMRNNNKTEQTQNELGESDNSSDEESGSAYDDEENSNSEEQDSDSEAHS